MFRGWGDGLPIQLRPDLAPAALLGVTIITPPVLNGRGSSPEHAAREIIAGRWCVAAGLAPGVHGVQVA